MHLLTRGAERFLQSLEIIGHEAPSLSCTGTTIHSKSARAATWRMSAFGGKRTLIDPHSGRPIISPVRGIGAMDYSAHNDEIRDNVKRMRRRLFTARLSAKKSAWLWRTLQNIIDWACVSVRSMIAILMVAALPVCAQAREQKAAKVTKRDAQNTGRIISGDKAKTKTYCDMVKLGEQIEQADKKDNKSVDELSKILGELGPKLGPEYAALMDGLEDIDPESEEGQEIESALVALDKLCTR